MFSILFVCTGNRCRSPYAHAVTQELAPDWVEIASAGTLDIAGARPPLELRQVADARGVNLSSYRSRPLTQATSEQPDLVIGMSLDHVATSVVNGGASAEKSFTFTEFVRLIETIGPEPSSNPKEAIAIVSAAHDHRTREKTFVPADDIEDPVGGPRRGYEEMADRIDDLSKRLAAGMSWT
ncbi:MAG TPA: hypothetical protein VEV82_09740 [Actinomycetota bacterium]|nr:hypothetical protein [Actinomycetota bacterium]